MKMRVNKKAQCLMPEYCLVKGYMLELKTKLYLNNCIWIRILIQRLFTHEFNEHDV